MQQLKAIFAVLVKQRFWVLSGIATLLILVSWMLGTSKLAAELTKYKSDVDKRFTELNSVVNQRPHPTQKLIENLQGESTQLRDQVADLWKNLYAKQRTKVLRWPINLQPEFLAAIEKRKFGDELDRPYREMYQNYVKERFEELPKIVQARVSHSVAAQPPRGFQPSGGRYGGTPSNQGKPPMMGPGASGGYRPNPPVPASTDIYDSSIVDWSADNFNQLQAKLVWQETPGSLKIWVTQEDLWIYETLLGIIAKTNADVTARHKAVVSAIKALQVGRDAAPGADTTGRIIMPGRTPKSGSVEGGMAPPGMNGMSSSLGTRPAQGGMPPNLGSGSGSRQTSGGPSAGAIDAVEKQLLEGRYLNAEGAAVASGMEEFKRVPVRMEVMMDPKKIYKLLTECANSPLPVEIHQVRINCDTSERGLTRPDQPGQPQIISAETMESDQGQRATHVPVVFQGIVYIFNPPEYEKLGFDAEQAKAMLRATAEAAASTHPAEQPPAGQDGNQGPGAPAPEQPAAGQPGREPDARNPLPGNPVGQPESPEE